MKTYKILLSFFLILMSGMGFSQSVPSYVPTNGLVGWWGFNGNAQDGSGNGNHGTVNGATLTTDRFGNQNGAYDFTVSNYITVFGLYQTDILQYTIASWFKKSSLNSNTDGTVVSGSNLQQSPSGIRLNMGTINRFQFQVEDSPGQNGIIELFPGVNVNYCDGQWHHVVGTFYAQSGAIPSSSFKLYIDGVEVSTISNFMNWPSWDTTTYAPVNNGGRSVIIGNSGPNFTGGFLGELDDIGIWNRALTQQEITNLYNSQLPTQTSLCLPTITTSSPSSVGVDSVVIGGDISNDGGSSIVLRGICYSTSTNPDMGNQRTEDGSGIGSFNTVLRGLTSSTTYYARSYAKNSSGVVVYGNEVSFSTSSINIGSNYAGGIVFYVDSTGQHGLVCAPSNQGNFEWGCDNINVPGTFLSIVGSGMSNTNLILAGCSQRPIAASVCDDLVLNGYSDWYLPSLDELQLMYTNLHVQSIGGLFGWYWSSSQRISGGLTWNINFDNGIVYGTGDRYNNFQVRAVRTF